jgi:hypothetical protein
VSTRRYNEARNAFNKMASTNGKGENLAVKYIFPKETHETNQFIEMGISQTSSGENKAE